MFRLTTAQALILYLSKQKTELFEGSIAPLFGGMWGIYGHGNVAGVGEALWKYQDDFPFFRGQNEQGMAHAAIAYTKALRCRRVMGVTTSIGPGATNLVTAAALAHTNRLPVLFLPGDVYASRRPDPVLQQLEDERSPLVSVNDCFIPVSRYFDRITRPEQLLESLPHAINTITNPATRGPVTLSLPQDVQAEVYDFPSHFFEESIHYIHRPRPDQQAVRRCADLILKSKRPLLILGGGVLYSGAEQTLRKFVEKHQIPFVETQAGKGALPWNHPLNLGAIGVTGTAAANALARDADLILCVGTRLSDFTSASKSLFHRPHTQLISINISPFDSIKGDSEPLVCDALEGLLELSSCLKNFRTTDAYLETIKKAKSQWIDTRIDLTKPKKSSTLPTDAEVVASVNETTAGSDSIVVCAAGGLPGELHKLWHTPEGSGYHVEYAYSCMGYEIAAGVGVKMAHPEKEIYVMVGDGSYLMMHTELLTSLQLGLKINVILLDNRGFGCINRLQKSCGLPPAGNLFDRERGPKVDFVANAASYGCRAVKANNLTELNSYITQNRQIHQSCVIVIEVDPEKGSPGTAWWDVAVAGISQVNEVSEARNRYEEMLKTLTGSHHE